MSEKRSKEAEPAAGSDPLGKLLARYSASQRGMTTLIAAVLLGLTGGFVRGAAGRLAYSLAQSQDGTPYAAVGWGLMVLGSAVAFGAVLQFGKAFEIRTKGVRFTRHRAVQELSWREILDIQVRKTTVRYRGSRVKTLWEVDLIGQSDTISLGSSFTRQLSSPTHLINTLRKVSGKEFEMPPLTDLLSSERSR